MKTILTLFLSFLTILSFSSSDTTYVSKTFKNDKSIISIEFISFMDSLGNVSTRVEPPIECDSLFLNLKNSLWSEARGGLIGIKLINRDRIGFITPNYFQKSDVSNISSIVVDIDGQSHIFKSNVIEDNVYFIPNLPPIELTPGDLLIQAGREKNIATGIYILSMAVGLLVKSTDPEGIIVISGIGLAVGLGFNISGNAKISKAGKMMNDPK